MLFSTSIRQYCINAAKHCECESIYTGHTCLINKLLFQNHHLSWNKCLQVESYDVSVVITKHLCVCVASARPSQVSPYFCWIRDTGRKWARVLISLLQKRCVREHNVLGQRATAVCLTNISQRGLKTSSVSVCVCVCVEGTLCSQLLLVTAAWTKSLHLQFKF